MKTKIFSLVLLFLVSGFVYAQNVPELMYYKFENNTATTTPNYASAPVGTNPAPVLGHTFTSGGQFDSCMSGTGGSGSTSYLNTGYNWGLGTGNWTISFWVSNLVDLNPTYLFGDPGSSSFRCFYGGAALPNSILFRGGFTDILIACPMPGSHVFHIVRDGGNIIVYRNGVLLSTNARTITMPAGSGFKIGGYSTSSFSMSGKMDEWRLYNRALTPAEITATWNIELPAGPTVCNYYASQWCAASTFPNLPAATYFQAAAWLGDTLYVQVPSTTGAAATTINRYTYGGTWTTGVPLPVAKSGGTLTKCGTKLYYIGGGSSVTVGSTDVYEYDPAAGTWTTKAPIPLALSAHGAGNWGDSVIFVVGGPYTGSGTNLNVYYYRPASNTWGTISASLPSGQGRRSHALAIWGNKIFMAAGYNTTFLKNMYIGTIGSNASSLTWAAGPDVPCGTWTGISRTGGTAYGNYFYLVAGERGGVGGYSDSTFVFNINTNAWHVVIDNKPFAMSNMWAAVTNKCINDTVKIFVPGGYTGAASSSFDVLGCGPTIVGNSKITSSVPGSYTLSQNYPNPFNPTTKISFTLPKNSDVKLVVFDILGKEVTTLVNDYRTAGTHEITFNADNLASGVYLYRIEAGDFKDVKRMMLVK